MPQAAPEPRKTLDPDRVAEWLARHPDFFVGREGLLQSLTIPHPETQGATSLLERLVHDLRKRAEGAELRLEQLLDSARHNEAQYRHYKKQQRRTEADGRAATGEDVVDEGDPDPLAYGHAPPVAKERVQALVEDMHDAALRRASWSRRRTFNEEKDVSYINRRNEVYNKKLERAFDPYTAEIRANLERGSAL